jgi:hypothetical protein
VRLVREFEAVARVSELNNALYSAFAQPFVRAIASPQVASAVLGTQPLRLRYATVSDQNPLMRMVQPLAEEARSKRITPDAENPFLKMQEQVSDMITKQLEAYGQFRDQTQEAIFHAVYGSPWLQASLGLKSADGPPRPKPGTSPDQRAALTARIEELRNGMAQGSLLEAGVRALIYITKGQRSSDARSFEILNRMLKEHPDVSFARFKATVREQSAMLAIDEKTALDTLPRLLPPDAEARRVMAGTIKTIVTAPGELEDEAKRRLREIDALLDVEAATPTPVRRPSRRGEQVGAVPTQAV